MDGDLLAEVCAATANLAHAKARRLAAIRAARTHGTRRLTAEVVGGAAGLTRDGVNKLLRRNAGRAA